MKLKLQFWKTNKVYLSDTVEPVYQMKYKCKLTKDITDTTETYS